MKLRSQYEGLAIPVTVATGDLAKDTAVEITADNTVDKAAADGNVIGRLVVSPTEAAGIGTVETRFKELVEIEADGALAAGDLVKVGAANGVIQTAKVADPADVFPRLIGVVLKGAIAGEIAEVLTF